MKKFFAVFVILSLAACGAKDDLSDADAWNPNTVPVTKTEKPEGGYHLSAIDYIILWHILSPRPQYVAPRSVVYIRPSSPTYVLPTPRTPVTVYKSYSTPTTKAPSYSGTSTYKSPTYNAPTYRSPTPAPSFRSSPSFSGGRGR